MHLASSRTLRVLTLALLASLAGCAKSSTLSTTDGGDDGSVLDGSSNDGGGIDASDAAVVLCPNGVVNPGESCDDGNMVNGDGCDNDCTFSAICGDGHLDAGEGCDDGNNRSGDGCDGLCRVESCGNMRLDAGEVCDGTPGCAADCKSVTTCGNSTVDAGEQCDDGNQTSWDGCSAACETEKSVVVSNLVLSNAPPKGCDVNLDGKGDNALGSILATASSFIGPLIMNQLQMPPFIVLTLLGVEDPTLVASDPNMRVAWLGATDADANANNNFDGTGTVHVVAATVNGTQPRLSFAGAIANAIVNAGPEDVTLPLLPGQAFGLARSHLVSTTYTVTTVGTETRYSVGTNAGHLCGTLPVNTVAALPNVLALAGGALPVSVPTNSCSPSVADNAVDMADVFLGGAGVTVGGFTLPVINAVTADVDFDGDGLETFELTAGDSCQAVVTACIDGDGTRIEGHDCTKDPRIADGWSSAFDFTAAPTRFVP